MEKVERQENPQDKQKEKTKVDINIKTSFFNTFGFKCLIVLFLVLILQIPMLFVSSLIRDRTDYNKEAINSILVPKGGQAEFQGILIAIPHETTETVTEGGQSVTRTTRRYLFVTPEKYDASLDTNVQMLKRGIFNVPVYDCDLTVSGCFDPIDDNSEIGKPLWAEAFLMLGISNKKNLTSLPEVKISGEVLRQSLMEPKIEDVFKNAIYYDLGERARTGFDFEFLAKIQGGKSIALTPLATDNKFSLRSNWKNVGFAGGWLPTEREIEESRSSAEWNIPGLSTVYPKRWQDGTIAISRETKDDYYYPRRTEKANSTVVNSESVLVNLFEGVDNYQKTSRSAKYSILFLLVPFIALLIFEVFSRVQIHPIQYSLIGLANIVFYLLLLSISEHIPFNTTYWIASAMVTVLLLFYGAAIFKKFSRGALFAAINFISYIFLFGTLQAEDNALLIGSIGIFGVLALLMMVTRKIDWYNRLNFDMD